MGTTSSSNICLMVQGMESDISDDDSDSPSYEELLDLVHEHQRAIKKQSKKCDALNDLTTTVGCPRWKTRPRDAAGDMLGGELCIQEHQAARAAPPHKHTPTSPTSLRRRSPSAWCLRACHQSGLQASQLPRFQHVPALPRQPASPLVPASR